LIGQDESGKLCGQDHRSLLIELHGHWSTGVRLAAPPWTSMHRPLAWFRNR